jgi:hypothetical protein
MGRLKTKYHEEIVEDLPTEEEDRDRAEYEQWLREQEHGEGDDEDCL